MQAIPLNGFFSLFFLLYTYAPHFFMKSRGFVTKYFAVYAISCKTQGHGILMHRINIYIALIKDDF